MARKISVKLIMKLRANGLSQTAIARSRHMSKSSVCEVFQIAEERKINYEDLKNLSHNDAYRLFYPDRHIEEVLFAQPDYKYIQKELVKVGVTLKLLWKEYKDKCVTEGEISSGYTKFCNDYAKYVEKQKITNHLRHKPGILMEVDWSGPTMTLSDPAAEKDIKVYLFVGTLPYSQYIYVEPCLDMKQNTWLNCHIHMFEFFGGTAVRLVCDNLKTGVISHPREGEIVLNRDYEALGEHYCLAIMPAQVRKAKQKASVEGSVGKIATAVIAKLRNEIFYNLDDLRVAVSKALKDFNEAPFQKRSGSRTKIFEEIERQYLRPLPSLRYEIVSWHYGRSVHPDCHVVFEKNHYSCPYRYAGKKVDLKVSDVMVEIYYKLERITSHKRFPWYASEQWSTCEEHLPDRFRQDEWNSERIMKTAKSIGKHTEEVVSRILKGYKPQERGYNPARAVLRLRKTYTPQRLENACELALRRFSEPRYIHLKSLLSSKEDINFAEDRNIETNRQNKDSQGFIRGAAYYGEHSDD